MIEGFDGDFVKFRVLSSEGFLGKLEFGKRFVVLDGKLAESSETVDFFGESEVGFHVDHG